MVATGTICEGHSLDLPVFRGIQSMSIGLADPICRWLHCRRGSQDWERSPSSDRDWHGERLKTPPPDRFEEKEPASGESPLAAMARCYLYLIPRKLTTWLLSRASSAVRTQYMEF
ncbi:MAG TPA: hypothetical protein VN729_00065 [Ktedonobacteraceae bacterium]|nr:hypothetical protein [Ktedonobacteraceae bacterium]